MSRDEFWGYTFREFDAIQSRHLEKRADDWAFHANLHRDSEARREPFTRYDFLPSRLGPVHKPLTPEQWLSKVRMVNAALGGEDLTHQNG